MKTVRNAPTPAVFGLAIRALDPGCRTTQEQLADWHRRIALAELPKLGLRVGSKAATKFLREAGL